MTRRPLETCQYCHTVKWPVRGLGRVCPRCDHLHAWPVIAASYRTPTHDPSSAVHPTDIHGPIAGKPYDWEQEGSA